MPALLCVLVEPVATRLSGPVLDAADAVDLAYFYARLLSWTVTEEVRAEEGTWAVIRSPSGRLKLEFQGLPDYQPPTWPNESGQQQMMMHLDIAVEDLEAGVAWAVELGATIAPVQFREGVRIMLDPQGHPFCLFPGTVQTG